MSRRFVGLSVVDSKSLPSRCAGCMYWQSVQILPMRCGALCDRQAADDWVSKVSAEWGECGRVAVEDGEFLGFIKYAPPRYLPQTRAMPAGPPLDDAPLITCMHIAAEARRHGLGGVLLRDALRDLVGRGERTVQAYALAQRVDYETAPMVGVDFLLRNGFTVARPHPDVPLLRLDLKSLVSWTDNLDTVLESLRIPVRVPKRAPATLSSSRKRRRGSLDGGAGPEVSGRG
ncbi:MAG: GNAT family N-acetyltransferase [Coriobacteriia bacterium]|nr:GNAT family N-acetyltransferase [Coriobacteriia bacterium]